MQAIILTGPMGSGKSAVGRQLARRLGWTFLDSDDVITEEQGRSIAEFFREEGEPAFRALEAETIRRLLETRPPLVLSLGGGAFLHPQTRETCLAPGRLSVYLSTSPEQSWQRIRKGSGPDRPLLQVEDPVARLTELLELRRPYYEQAQLHLNTDNRSVRELVEDLLEYPGL